MTEANRTTISFPVRRIALLVIFSGLGLVCAVKNSSALPQNEGDGAQSPVKDPISSVNAARLGPNGPWVDRSRFLGARGCLGCHRSEYVAWTQTKHYSSGRLEKGESRDKILKSYAEITGSTPKAAMQKCQLCHDAPAAENFGRTHEISGVSCESCHGASGGEEGWMNRHPVYGPNLTRMENETPDHRAARTDYCDRAGMIRAPRVYEMAKTCLGCHIVGDEQLLAAGHKPGQDTFGLPAWTQGEVRHNFHMNQHHNARVPSLITARNPAATEEHRAIVMIVVAPLAKVEVCLRNIAAVSKEVASEDDEDEELSEAASGWQDKFSDAFGYLVEMSDYMDENESAASTDLQAIVETVEAILEDEELKPGLTRGELLGLADALSRLGRQFVDRHDGSQLEDFGEEFLDETEPKGKAFEPK